MEWTGKGARWEIGAVSLKDYLDQPSSKGFYSLSNEQLNDCLNSPCSIVMRLSVLFFCTSLQEIIGTKLSHNSGDLLQSIRRNFGHRQFNNMNSTDGVHRRAGRVSGSYSKARHIPTRHRCSSMGERKRQTDVNSIPLASIFYMFKCSCACPS